MNFFETDHCVKEGVCSACRDTGNVEFRVMLMEMFDGIEALDFDCPRGKARNEHVAVVNVSPELRAMDFSDLFDMVMDSGDARGIAMARNEKDLIESAECTECRKTRAASILRVWLNNKELSHG